jgi:hypothetical protein
MQIVKGITIFNTPFPPKKILAFSYFHNIGEMNVFETSD